jgi:hypothetical protein
MNTKKNTALYITLAAMTLLGACAQQSSNSGNVTTSRGTSNNNNGNSVTPTESVRYCDTVITGATSSRLSDFFSVVVSQLEGDPTFCHDITGYGSSGVKMNLMIEYEDRYGIRSVEFTSDQVLSGRLIESNSTTTSLEVIFKDAYGLVKVVASGPTSTGILSGSIYYYNFPTYEEALNQAITELQTQCRNGTKTVYECMGYTYPTAWWNQTLSTSQVDMAKNIMNDSTKRKQLGTVKIDIGESNFPN